MSSGLRTTAKEPLVSTNFFFNNISKMADFLISYTHCTKTSAMHKFNKSKTVFKLTLMTDTKISYFEDKHYTNIVRTMFYSRNNLYFKV